jgi:hypothetical protein
MTYSLPLAFASKKCEQKEGALQEKRSRMGRILIGPYKGGSLTRDGA